LAEAGNTQLSCAEIGCEKNECKIGGLYLSHVGHEGRRISACEGTVVILHVKEGKNFRNAQVEVLMIFTSARAGPVHTPIVRVVLGANRRLERTKCIEDVINEANTGDGSSVQLSIACNDEICEILANIGLGTRAGYCAVAKIVQSMQRLMMKGLGCLGRRQW